jgi:uncharacterized membrane protein HdeD (DUF308 family)
VIEAVILIAARLAVIIFPAFSSALFVLMPGWLLIISLLLVVYFMMEGVSKTVFALTIRSLKIWLWLWLWLWVLASAILSVRLSMLPWASIPITALWLVGLLPGIPLIPVGTSPGDMAMFQHRRETV